MVSDNPLQQVRESAKWVSEHADNVKIDPIAINEFLTNLKKDEYDSKSSTVIFPLNFSTPKHEVNFWFILDLINFGSGFRKELHEASKRGAYETICYGLFGMYLSQSGNLSANFLNKLSLNEISSFFSIPIIEEYEMQPGIYTCRDTPLKPLALKIQQVLKESSEVMLELGFDSFADFVWKITDPVKTAQKGGCLASNFVKELVTKIPAFNDQVKYKDHNVFIFKKAQLLAADLNRRFKDSESARFNFTDIDQITVFTDNVLPAVLRKFGILKLSKELEEKLDNGGELLPGNDEVELRVQAIQASIEIVEMSKTRPDNFIKNSLELDYYLWTKGKDESFRNEFRDENNFVQDDLFKENELLPIFDNNDYQVLLNSFNISLDRDRQIIYNITKGKHYTQLQLLENDRVLGFFLDKVRDYLSENGFDVIKFEQLVKLLCNSLFVCKIPFIGSAISFIIDSAGILLEAQCYRDIAENLPAPKGGIQLTGISLPKLL
ncbi:hypothetical protein DICPUDRAFT_51328 [Dictyostelium purpureum]|uniref:Queuosine 5'-phosphate N-glycosylase/hydrolase n=1 Tax=Dictyostelium purpureum TaxID=5786 RepID=F1A374_DICPU|nr:uncharacterized protein DICPUDRAFT_51328 [Dictyostelium purpureum]EGC29356.1 hypothetical protein DICPUDRAFT_51328 [Dictyostelium purpureum]|eukprot:XP_003294120.1 hypothetical protein DICPUDRAFT_51328 [Dictyostelium purpureum]